MLSQSGKKGKIGEKLAAWYLRMHGYKIVNRNYRPQKGIGAGEVDIIALKNKLLIFVEVKTRQSREAAAYSILPEQMQRIMRSAEIFIAENPNMADFDIRFDAILIGNKQKPLHIKDAFRSDF